MLVVLVLLMAAATNYRHVVTFIESFYKDFEVVILIDSDRVTRQVEEATAVLDNGVKNIIPELFTRHTEVSDVNSLVWPQSVGLIKGMNAAGTKFLFESMAAGLSEQNNVHHDGHWLTKS